MSKDLPEGLAFKEDLNLYRCCNGNLNFSTVSHDDEDYVYQKKKIMRDPMSHRIIEKRRRDRMNNCLADLSRLIPPGYLKKGRGRIEKTEIIEMAIKHMRHLQSIISSSRTNDGRCENAMGSYPGGTTNKDSGIAATTPHQPIIMEHYRLGYLECLSEAMHFLVEVQGYFAGDSLCVQMINHLHKHCDKLLKSDSLNQPRKHIDTSSSNSSTSPTNGSYGENSPPLGLSLSNGSNSDDNQANLSYENVQSPRRYPDFIALKKSCNYLRYSEVENERVSENPSDSDVEQGCNLNGRSRDTRDYLNCYRDSPKCRECIPKDCSSSSGIGSNPTQYDEFLVKEENTSSQLRDMLASPRPIHHPLRESDIKRSTSPPIFGCDINRQRTAEPFPVNNQTRSQMEIFKYKSSEAEDGVPQEVHHESASDAPGNMYKFKNNIKQRFSKEKRNHESDEENSGKKIKLNELSQAPHLKEIPSEEEFKRNRSFSETETHADSISSRLNFGHKVGNRPKEGAKYNQLPSPCPNPEMPVYYKSPENGRKPVGLLAITEYLSAEQSLHHKCAAPEGVGVPIFALHSKGSFYIPLTLDQSVLSPYLPLLGLTKTEETDEKPVLHPVTISVNFQTSYLSRNSKQIAIPWK